MKTKFLKNKKIVIGVLVILIVGAISVPLFFNPKEEQTPVREREYLAKKDNITVGVETSGQINTLPNTHTFEENTVVDELFVKVGSEVKKGDMLATISLKNLKELIQVAKDELSDARATLLQASSAKDLLLSQNEKNKQDGVNGIHQEFDAKLEQLASDKSRIQKSIKDYESKIEKLEKQISELSPQVEDVERIIADLKSQINANIIKIGELNEKLLKVDDRSIERAYLNQKISNAQSQIQDLNTKIAATDNEEEIDRLTKQIEQLKSQIQNAQNELLYLSDGSNEMNAIRLEITKLQNKNTALQQEIDKLSEKSALEESLKKEYAAFSLKLEEIQSTEKQYEQSLETQNKDNDFADYKVSEELKAINENISKANRNVGYAQEKLNVLFALEKNPTLYAEMDGIVTALNYKTGDVVVNGKPLCVIGQLSEITMTVPVSAADIGSISIGQKVNIFVDAFAEQKFTGTVTERLLVANDNGDYPVTLSIALSEQMLLPGMKAFATIILKEKTDILTISNKAILLENGAQYVNMKRENGELVKTKVVTGFSDGRISEVLDGLSENDIAVVQE